MNKIVAIKNLIDRIAAIHRSTKEPLNNNIYRGHSRSISTDIEDSVALLLSELLPESYSFMLDPSIYIDGKNNRPDLLVLNSEDEVIAMIEIKANMGWCRNASSVLNGIFSMISNSKKQISFGVKYRMAIIEKSPMVKGLSFFLFP